MIRCYTLLLVCFIACCMSRDAVAQEMSLRDLAHSGEGDTTLAVALENFVRSGQYRRDILKEAIPRLAMDSLFRKNGHYTIGDVRDGRTMLGCEGLPNGLNSRLNYVLSGKDEYLVVYEQGGRAPMPRMDYYNFKNGFRYLRF